VKEQSPANKMKARAWLSRIWACLMFGTALSALHLYGTIGGWWWGLVIFSAIVSGVGPHVTVRRPAGHVDHRDDYRESDGRVVTSMLFNNEAEGSVAERLTMASAPFGERIDSLGRYKLPLLPGESGTKSGGDWVPFGIQSATNLAGSIVESRQLGIWERRKTQIGLALRPDLAEQQAILINKALLNGFNFAESRLQGEGSTAEGNAIAVELDRIHAEAKQSAGGNLAAQRGTNRHDVWEARAQTGHLLGTPAVNEQIERLEQLLEEKHLRRVPGLQERVVRNVALRAAGKFDDVLQTTENIYFPERGGGPRRHPCGDAAHGRPEDEAAQLLLLAGSADSARGVRHGGVDASRSSTRRIGIRTRAEDARQSAVGRGAVGAVKRRASAAQALQHRQGLRARAARARRLRRPQRGEERRGARRGDVVSRTAMRVLLWWHRRHGEPVDFACRVVHATYERERRWRATERSDIRSEALAALAGRHPTEFAQLMARITAERKQSQQVVDSPTGIG
jgi:hypothetical protein